MPQIVATPYTMRRANNEQVGSVGRVDIIKLHITQCFLTVEIVKRMTVSEREQHYYLLVRLHLSANIHITAVVPKTTIFGTPKSRRGFERFDAGVWGRPLAVGFGAKFGAGLAVGSAAERRLGEKIDIGVFISL